MPTLTCSIQVKWYSTHITGKWIRPVDLVILTISGMTGLYFRFKLVVRSMQGSFSESFAVVEE